MLRKIVVALAAWTVLIHVFLGGHDTLAPMLAAHLAPEVEGAMHACWHMVTLLLVWSVVVFWKGGQPAFHFAALWLASAVVFIYVGTAQSGFGGLIVNPQWTILGLTGALALLSCRVSKQSEAII